ncbi:MAG: hypothetical protein Q8K65_09255 [Alphaproteobacteria bacterium]|nr:hypothetical protein [Alphaproteobacteria bacterium]
MNKKTDSSPTSPAAQRFAATRRAMGAGAFERLADTATEPRLPDVLRDDPIWAPLRRDMPWLPDLARMEALAAETLDVPPAPPLDAAGLEQAARDPMQLRLSLQPHIRLLRSGWDIPAIWQTFAAGTPIEGVLPVESFTVIYNDGGNAAVWSVTEPAYAVLEGLDSDPDFAKAAAAALRIDKGFALDQFLALLIQQRLLLKK